MYDTIIIGGGPSGISAAIYLRRFNRNVLVIMKDYGALEKAHVIENYYGTNKINGLELAKTGVKQAQDLGVDVVFDEALKVDGYETFEVKTVNNTYYGKSVLLATGKARGKEKIKGARELVGQGVSYCAVCDGFLYRGKNIGIVGNGEYMLEELSVLANFSENITIFTNGLELEKDIQYRVMKDTIENVDLVDEVLEVNLEDNKVKVDALFLAEGSPNAVDFARTIGAVIENSNIVVDDKMMTNIPGLFACGDAIGGILQVSKAVNDGANAANMIHKYLNLK